MSVLLFIGVAIVFAVLVTGIVVFAMSDKINDEYSEQLMWSRVGTQAAVVAVLTAGTLLV